jgi:iron complex outermembrane receptor protein
MPRHDSGRARALGLVALLLCLAARPIHAQGSAQLTSLKQLSLDELLKVEVSTVSRKEERWWTAPSGIDVVTGEEIRRSGARNLPDALRLATGVHVAQPSARSWAVSIRWMNVLAANKISVLMDGRSLFTPFFSGVQWDAQDTLLEDIDRIEVVRGPVGALWGAFAVNGFIQILTKPAWDTQGLLASAGGGTEDPLFLSFRYGGKAGKNNFYRVYAKYAQADWTYDARGNHAQSATDFLQTGFRFDGLRPNDTTLTLQGDFYANRNLLRDVPEADISGGNVLGRWRRMTSGDASLQVEGYLDHTYRLIPLQFEEQRNTASASIKYQNTIGRNEWVAGFDGLVSRDRIGNIGIAQLIPDRRTTHTAGVYAQDVIQFAPRPLALTLGAKADHNSFSGWEWQPTARLAWTPSPRVTAWTAISRAVRTPVRIDQDFTIRVGSTTLFEANDAFGTEHAVAYEIGWRQQPASTLTFDVSGFVYRYDDLRSTEPPAGPGQPATFRNLLNAQSYGGETSVMWQPLPRLFFKGSYRYLDLDFTRDPTSGDTSRGSAEGNDPKHVVNLGGHLDLPGGVELDAFFRYASALPHPALPGYRAVDLRLGWNPSTRWELSLALRNLLTPQHAEFVTTNSLNEQVHSSATLKATWRY